MKKLLVAWRPIILLALFFTMYTSLNAQDDASTPPEPTFPEVEYISDGHPRHRLDIFLPDSGDTPYPVLLTIHGGGFLTGDKSIHHPIVPPYLELGYAVVTVNYRLAPEHPYPAAVSDVLCAVAWLHAEGADFDLDPAQLVVLGDSAGGTLAALVGAVDERIDFLADCPHPLPDEDWVQGIMAFYPIADMLSDEFSPGAIAALEDYLGVSLSQAPSVWEAASPLSWVDGSEAPFLILHGTDDKIVPASQSLALAAALEAAEVPVELVLLPQATHDFMLGIGSEDQEDARAAVIEFLSGLRNQDEEKTG